MEIDEKDEDGTPRERALREVHELIDRHGKPLGGSFPMMALIGDLLEAEAYKASDLDDFNDWISNYIESAQRVFAEREGSE
jgi:hypothetical protein